ncbi:hypothetical protein HDK77DRAFT_6213 [Phyllosticta capitalensis]|uniref:Uncharacterized protein n=1 Tax=Phyllosticta capitalensis TaxID=121624 RepID=A0ABR1YZA1_9PEZI
MPGIPTSARGMRGCHDARATHVLLTRILLSSFWSSTGYDTIRYDTAGTKDACGPSGRTKAWAGAGASPANNLGRLYLGRSQLAGVWRVKVERVVWSLGSTPSFWWCWSTVVPADFSCSWLFFVQRRYRTCTWTRGMGLQAALKGLVWSVLKKNEISCIQFSQPAPQSNPQRIHSTISCPHVSSHPTEADIDTDNGGKAHTYGQTYMCTAQQSNHSHTNQSICPFLRAAAAAALVGASERASEPTARTHPSQLSNGRKPKSLYWCGHRRDRNGQANDSNQLAVSRAPANDLLTRRGGGQDGRTDGFGGIAIVRWGWGWIGR